MTIPLEAEQDVMLQDWGRALVHRAVIAVHDPVTQISTETVEDTPLLGIPCEPDVTISPGTAGEHRTRVRAWLIRDQDWPEVAEGAIRRLVTLAGEFDVLTLVAAPLTGWKRVTARLR